MQNTFSLFGNQAQTQTLFDAALSISAALSPKTPVSHRELSALMSKTVGGTDASGRWDWGQAHDAAEAALAVWLRKHWKRLIAGKRSSVAIAQALSGYENMLPTRTRRSDETQDLQQFSTPLDLAFAAVLAAKLRPGETVMEPSAGTGLMALMAEFAGGQLVLNEISDNRAALLRGLFPVARTTQHDAEKIDNLLPQGMDPDVVVMNPPFTRSLGTSSATQDASYFHIRSALNRLKAGGRLVAITLDSFHPAHPRWGRRFERLGKNATLVFSAGIDRGAFSKHGTGIAVRLHVFDKRPAGDTSTLKACHGTVSSIAELIALMDKYVPCRASGAAKPSQVIPLRAVNRTAKRKAVKKQVRTTFDQDSFNNVVPLKFATRLWQPAPITSTGAIYEGYEPQLVDIEGAHEHPAALVQSAAMASVAPPKALASPKLPRDLVTNGALSAAQLEAIIYANQAHEKDIDGLYYYDEETERLVKTSNQEKAVPLRTGFFIGDGPGVGKGREVAGVILSNFLEGRTKAVWISETPTLIEDARRDWAALGGNPDNIVSLSKFSQAEEINLESGILYLTYATLRAKARQGKLSRLEQIASWLGRDFEGALIFDEAHAMANAAGGKGSRGKAKPSQQGKAGLKLQRLLPRSRVVYASATGATEVTNLAYAERLGLWLGAEFPFASRDHFITSMVEGGLAALEIVARDLKSLGLYTARALSFEGVVVDLLTHDLTAGQVDIYNKYADAWAVIHNNLEAALEAVNITSLDGTLNGQAKSAALSAFEGNKQRFFNHLLTSMKMPSLIRAVEQDLEEGRAAVVQLVSTGEALLNRRLAEIPKSDWANVMIDVTPREYIMDYLMHSFPVQAHDIFEDEDGERASRPAFDEAGNAVFCREAVEARDKMLEELSCLPPIQTALDQMVQHFGHGKVAEVTGRKLRIIKEEGRFRVAKRSGNANFGETDAFMDGDKNILVFSNAGGTGRSYHADRSVKNTKQRVHYLLESGWQAYKAIQGLGRSNRSNQASKPIVRPVTTNVRGERRFISTICKRLDSLGALTRGQRQTGGQGLFREEDNLESKYARAALQAFYRAIYDGKVEACSLEKFEQITGLKVRSKQDGSLLERLPPLNRFLNRILALRIEIQDAVFDAFEKFIAGQIHAAKEDGTFEKGLETLWGDSFRIVEEIEIYSHTCGTNTVAYQIERKKKRHMTPVEIALEWAGSKCRYLYNKQSSSYGILRYGSTITNKDGGTEQLYIIDRPHTGEQISETAFERSFWEETTREHLVEGWTVEAERRKTKLDRFWIITGLLLPVWDKLGQKGRVWRLETDDNQRLLGRVIDNVTMLHLQRQFAKAAKLKLNAEDLSDMIMTNGAKVHFEAGFAIVKSFVAGNYRIEAKAHSYDMMQNLKSYGCYSEYHSFQQRLFLPTGPEGLQILNAIANNNTISEVA